MELALRKKMNEIRAKVRNQQKSNEEGTQQNQQGIPNQYPTMKKVNLVDKEEEDPKDVVASLCENLATWSNLNEK